MLNRIAGKVRDIETMTLIDSTGISSTITQEYLDTNRGRKVVREANPWFKAPVVDSGVTGIVVDVIVTDYQRNGRTTMSRSPRRTSTGLAFSPPPPGCGRTFNLRWVTRRT